MNSLMFLTFAEFRRRLPETFAAALFSGAVAGVVTATLSTPFDYVKIQAQIRGAAPLDVLGAALREPRPLAVLFRGHASNCLREGVFTAVYLGSYDVARAHLVVAGDARPPLYAVAAASAASGALAWVANYPFDTVKSVQQSAPPGTASRSGLGAAQALWRRGGLAAFYRGIGPSTARAILVTCSRLVAFEWIRGLLVPTPG